jgi:hypothetical protein
MFSLLPKETVFFELFEQAGKNAHDASQALAALLDDFRDGREGPEGQGPRARRRQDHPSDHREA